MSLDYFSTVARWNELKSTIAHLQAEERALREGLFAGTFPDPKEGTNTYELPDGSKLKGTYKLSRKLDEEKLKALVDSKKIPAKLAKDLKKIKVELDLKNYRKVPTELLKEVDKALEIKPSLPTLEFIPAPVETTEEPEFEPEG